MGAVYRKNSAKRIISDYGFDFWDLEEKANEMGIDYYSDYYNGQHLNIYGSIKLTRYLSNLLIEKYKLSPTSIDDNSISQWTETVSLTKKFVSLAKYQIEKGIDGDLYESSELIKRLKEE